MKGADQNREHYGRNLNNYFLQSGMKTSLANKMDQKRIVGKDPTFKNGHAVLCVTQVMTKG